MDIESTPNLNMPTWAQHNMTTTVNMFIAFLFFLFTARIIYYSIDSIRNLCSHTPSKYKKVIEYKRGKGDLRKHM